MTAAHLAWLWLGEPEHAISALARTIGAAAGGPVAGTMDPHRLRAVVASLDPDVRTAHLHTNDWLFRRSGADAPAVVEAVAGDLHTRGRQLTLTLHDLPHPGAHQYEERAADYARMAAAAAAVVVSSDHEKTLLTRAAPQLRTPVHVVPLPVDVEPTGEPVASEPAEIGVLGFLFPGKGHAELIDEVAGSGWRILALGRPSDGQEYLADALRERADGRGVSFRITGWIPEADLVRRLRAVRVPVAPHTEVSASGSINSWIAAGRRPLVAAGPYTRELERRVPGAVRLYEPGTLVTEVRAALAQPDTTWWGPDVAPGPATAEVAARYRSLLQDLT
ncbi:hypothetical protein GIS00_11710 [Nakamurella sp. YIM 132087]|uniref:Glycosyltransferase n=1 Tax=Nakamurella alba TaxID=2665158 RepID=A0A7K1FKH9_9ACTN|nr:glycosyltransferase [Nakamurella alba]MTD14608.1 hypothetical protein [Nakamurella alba]